MKQNRNNIESQMQLLKDALEHGIINIDGMYDNIMASKRQQVKKMHPYAITPPSKNNPKWQTYYKSDGRSRKLVRAHTENELLDKLIPFYLSESNLDKITFYELFEEWLEYKKTITNSPNTIKRHKQHYKKYFESSVLHDKCMKKIDELFLEQECNRIVKEFNLSRKEWVNVKTILNGMYEYAVRKKYLAENTLSKTKIYVKYRQVVRKTGKTETYNTDELSNLNRYLDTMYEETNDTSFLAVKVNFLLGLRVGELVALRWSDIVDEKHLHIVCEEVRNQDTNEYEVVDHTKTHKDRFVILVEKASDILQKIEHQGEFVFMRNGKRLTARQIAYVLEKYAERNGIPTKSTHKMRKTYASKLNAQGVPLDCIREMLGHSQISTTLGYLYNPLTEGETFQLISNAL